MGRILFYLRYAWRNLSRSARWTTFGVFCIAAGVATVVALRTLGLSIGDSLVDNVRQNLHGDIRLSTEPQSGGFAVFNFDSEPYRFPPDEVDEIESVVSEAGGTISGYSMITGMQVTRLDAVTVGRPQFVSGFLIDPATFPPTGEIRAQDPSGANLSDLLAGDNTIVISRNLAEQNQIAVGDTVRVSGTEEEFTVTGIVSTDIEAGIQNLIAGFFGFAYISVSEADTLGADTAPGIISIALPDGTPDEAILATEQTLLARISGTFSTTRPELSEQYQVIGDYIGRFIVIMGLGALLIGGVGIINTMLVMVGRRSYEIAALKTFGLKGRQVFWLFMSEAFLLGAMGSIVGCIFGVFLSVIVNQYGAAFLQQGLTWRLYPEAIGYGLSLGMVVTLVFGILPILTANKVRPAAILRPNETTIPRAGVFHSLIAIALVVVVIGSIAGAIIGNIEGPRGFMISGIPIGILGVLFTLIILGILVMVFWVIVWVVSKLPAFGIVDLRLALRNLTARRLRTATTLMALAAGMFALSAITFVGVGTREILNFSLSQTMGGNVLVFPLASVLSPTLADSMLDAGLNGIDGIQYRTRMETYSGVLEAVDGTAPEFALPFDMEEANMPDRARRAFSSISMTARVTDNPSFANNIVEGRGISPEDNGSQVMVLPEGYGNQFTNVAPHIGSIMQIRIGSQVYQFEVIGFERVTGTFGPSGQAVIPPETLQMSSSGFSGFTILQVESAQLNQVLLDLSALPFVFTLDITFIDGFLSRIINQFAAIPTVVGLLSLLAAAVTMANTVSLSTLERRRQIGILKAVGLKGSRVLRIMIIENVLIGVLGGVLGMGVSALMVAAMTALGVGDAIPIPRDAVPLAIALLVASVVIALISTFLSSGVAVRERVANVLRYE